MNSTTRSLLFWMVLVVVVVAAGGCGRVAAGSRGEGVSAGCRHEFVWVGSEVCGGYGKWPMDLHQHP